MTALVYAAADEAATERLGAALADVLPGGAVVALQGPLGAGKTRLVRAIAAALGVPRDEVSSPTFVLCHEYRGRRPVFHFDAYRVKDAAEFLDLGAAELLESEDGGISLIEWADRVAAALPEEHLRIDVAVTGESERTFTLAARGPEAAVALAALRETLPFRDGG